MAKVTYFVYCLNAERRIAPDGNGESLNANGILATMIPEFVPGTFSFSTVFCIMGIDTKKSNIIKIVFKNGEGKESVNTGDINVPPATNKEIVSLPDDYVGYNMSMDFRNVILESEGEYITEVYMNGELIYQAPIYVKGKRSVAP